MRVRDYNRAQTELLLAAKADGDRTGIDRESVVDQIGCQQLMPPIPRAGDDSDFHCEPSLARNCASASLLGLTCSSLPRNSRAAAASPFSNSAVIRFCSVFSWRGS